MVVKINMNNSLKSIVFKEKKLYLIIFLIPFVIMFLAYAFFGVKPFGEESVLVLDLNAQYVCYYEAFRDAFWGEGSLIYSWSRNLSGEMFGIFGYYLASPFSIIPILLPRSIMTYSIEIMELLKLGTCAVTFAFFLKTRRNSKAYTVLIFSAMYALCGYAVVQIMNPMWIDGLIYLPIIFVGVEKLVEKGRMAPLIIPLALMFMANYYIGYMIGILTAFYFIYYFFYCDERPVISQSIKTFLKFAISAIVAILCAMIVIYPVYQSLKLGKFDFTEPKFEMKPQFTIVEMLAKLLPFSYDTVKPEGRPLIYSGVLSILLVPLYFMNNNIKLRQKICNGTYLFLLTVLMYLKPLDMAMHGFQVPNWLPFRYSFVFSFIFIVMAAQAFDHLEGVTFKEIGGVFAAALGFVIFLESERFDYIEPFGAIAVSILFLAIYFAVLYMLKKGKSKGVKSSILVLVCCELFIVSLKTVVDIDNDVVYSSYKSYAGGYIEDGRETVDMIEEKDDGLYRIEKTFQRTVNDAMVFGMKGISHSSSTMNAKAIDFLGRLGFSQRGHYTKYNGETLITDAILGIKYVMTKKSEKTMLMPYTELFTNKDITVYKNDNALSIGYMVNENTKGLTFVGKDPFVVQNSLMSTMISDEGKSYFKKIAIDDVVDENLATTAVSGHTKYTPIDANETSTLRMTITAPTDEMIYAFFPTNYERQCTLVVNGITKGSFFEGENYRIVQIGEFEAGEKVEVELKLRKEEMYLTDKLFYYLDEELFFKDLATLQEGQWNITEFTATYLKGEVTAKEGQMMMTTIPYEEGWSIEVDGVKTEPVMMAKALIGFEVPAGTYTVTMRFFPKYFLFGIIISIFGLILLIVIILVEKHTKKRLLDVLHDKPNKNYKDNFNEELSQNQDNLSIEKMILDSLQSDNNDFEDGNDEDDNDDEDDDDEY